MRRGRTNGARWNEEKEGRRMGCWREKRSKGRSRTRQRQHGARACPSPVPAQRACARPCSLVTTRTLSLDPPHLEWAVTMRHQLFFGPVSSLPHSLTHSPQSLSTREGVLAAEWLIFDIFTSLLCFFCFLSSKRDTNVVLGVLSFLWSGPVRSGHMVMLLSTFYSLDLGASSKVCSKSCFISVADSFK